jgi:hypothetical protein
MIVLVQSIGSPPAHAGTNVTTIQPSPSSMDDSFLREDNLSENNDNDPTLRVRSTHDQKNRNSVLQFPLSGLSGRTVLRAWLELRQSAANGSVPIDTRVYPLTESWSEANVTWSRRDIFLLIATPWSTPGGTHSPYWTDRVLISPATNSSTVQWQVGPLVQAWNAGWIANNGVLLEPDRIGPAREASFHSSDYGTATLRPKLVIHSTDEPPAIREGTAEIQPRTARVGAIGVPLTAWLDVDATGSTPSGTGTGFDAILVTHEGALAVTAVDRLVVGGASIPTSLVSWTDDGQAVTFRVPRIRIKGQVQLDFRATVLAPASSYGNDLPISVDDTATPGAWSQQLWPGNADRIAGNGDDWILRVVDTPPVAIDLTPDIAQMRNLSCLALTVLGRDVLGNVFPIQPDSVRVVPSTAGTMQPGLSFCAVTAGFVKLIAHYGALRDSSTFEVLPERLTQVHAVALLDEKGASTKQLVPGDTMFVDVTLSDGDGLQDVDQVEFEVVHPSSADKLGKPAYGATFRWTRGGAPAWSLVAPIGSTWEVLPALCGFDAASISASPANARLAFVVSRVARASDTGEWTVHVHAHSQTPSGVTSGALTGLDLASRLVVRTLDALGAFSPGLPGAMGLALETPADARLHLEFEANVPFSVAGRATDLVGVSNPLDTLFVSKPVNRLHWSFTANPDSGGDLAAGWTALVDGKPQEDEAVLGSDLHLWLDHPAGSSEQDYAGSLALRLESAAPGDTSSESGAALRATVVAAGLAAQLALAEVTPHTVKAGANGQIVDVYFRPVIQGTDTGVDRLRVSMPEGWGTPSISEVKVAGIPVAFEDRSSAGLAEVALASKVTSSQVIRLRLVADAPSALDLAGSPFVVVYDDESTIVPPQTASEGDANGVLDGNNWTVSVVPGSLARIVVTPSTAVMAQDSSATFTAAGEDALGHAVGVTAAWRVEGGIGTVGAASGLFEATTPGVGSLIAESGVLADSAYITVLPPRAMVVRSVTGPSLVYQGQTAVQLTVRIANTAPATVTLDTLDLLMSRATPGDANGDFTITIRPPAPVILAAGTTTALPFWIDVAFDALTAPLAVQAVASGVEEGSGIRLRDTSADTSLALNVLAGGIEVAASQTPGMVRPGARNALLLTLHATNHYPELRTLASVILANRTQGPGDRDQLDVELGEVTLYRDDGDGTFEPSEDAMMLQTSALDGIVTLAPLAEPFAALAAKQLFVAVTVPTAMRDGDLLDVEVTSVGDLSFEPAVAFRNGWPVGGAGGLTIDGMIAAQVVARPVGPSPLSPDATDQLALDLLLPANGYTADVLTRLAVVNLGTASATGDLSRLRAWADDGDDAFAAATDALLGTLVFTGGDRWQLTGLSQPVPLAGRRVFVTVDATSRATENATVKLALPAGPDFGVGMASGNSGPVDVPVANPGHLTVSLLDRVALAALPLPGGNARPGERERPLLHFVLTNNYSTPKTLTTLVLDNATSGPGTAGERDGETKMLALRADGNGDGVLDDTAVDPVIATGFFGNGVATFTGLDVELEPFKSRQLFVTADVSLADARDGDVLGALVAGPNSVAFKEPTTTTTGSWPLDSGARWTVDGWVAAQARIVGAPSATVGPNDGPILALDVVVPPNGYSPDVLRGVRVANLGTAGNGDLAAIELWRDGGDGTFSGGGDDLLLGPLTPSGEEWTSPLLAEAVQNPGARLFVSVRIAAAPAESATVRLAIPIGGSQYDSANDGPLDLAVENHEAILISAAPLLASFEAPRASTLGQTVRVMMAVRNRSTELVRGIVPPPLVLDGSAGLVALTGPIPATFDLVPAAIDSFTWEFTADAIGEVRFVGSAEGAGDASGLPRRSPLASSNLHRVYEAAQHLVLTPVRTMPIRVNRGQTDVVPFSLTLFHPGGPDAADVRVDRLRVRLEDESGAPIVPGALLDRVQVNEGTNVYLVKTALETSGSEIDLPLATPATVTGTEPTTLSLRLDIAAGTAVPNFRVVIDDSLKISAQDGTSGVPVAVRLATGAYPLRSNATSVVAEATQLDVTASVQDTVRAGRGNTGVTFLKFRLESPGVSGISSNVRVATMAVALLDSAGVDQPAPGATLSGLRLLAGTQVLAQRTVDASDGAELALPFLPPLELGANTPLDLVLVGDLTQAAPFGRLSARLLDSTRVDARDANTRAPLPVRYVPDAIVGGVVRIEAPAETLFALGTPTMPSAVVIGESNVPAFRALFRHPGVSGTARIRVDRLVVECLDDLRRPLVPATHFDRMQVRWNGADVADVTGMPTTGNRVEIALPGFWLEAGDSARVELRVDIDASAPAGFLELVVPVGEALAYDANTNVPVALAAGAGEPLPLHSGLARLTSPSRELAVGMTSLMAATLVGDARAVPVATLRLRNADAEGSGAIQLAHLVVRAGNRAFVPLPVGAAAERLEAWVNGALWAQSAALTPDSVTACLSAAQVLLLAPDDDQTVELRLIPRAGFTGAGLRLGLDRPDVGVIQPASALLAINVRPEPGLAFPFWTEAGEFAGASLEESYANFPNPFAAGREATTVVYYLPEAGRVSLRIFTLRGEPVATLLDGVVRPAGLSQSDVWDGRNGSGNVVINGVYVAELDVRFDGGTARRLHRKVAVVR